ncbi:WXG100 family type VII secretion target [Nocardioides limicola]|uniref:WXG100 family type VII secretion target n=1 Tax=Nocardioides limicola TaxID=2803368 RepID=UPI00193C2D44|nr:WXG100 family type VII secretion target [Nocardioides sp. DJM-14]
MSQGFSAADRALTRAAEKVAGCKGDLDGLAKQMDGEMEALRARWGGQGAVAFQRLKTAWLENQRRITAALDGFESSLIETEKDNVATDEAASAVMTNISSRLS